jgi:cytochrome-b5 reductase
MALRPSVRPTAALLIAFAIAGSGFWLATPYIICNVFAESIEAPKAFWGFPGPSLRLQSSESVNHNTKRLRFLTLTRVLD